MKQFTVHRFFSTMIPEVRPISPYVYGPFEDHIPDERLEQFVLGSLCEAEIAAIEEHLVACQECDRRLIEVEEFITAVRTAARGRPTNHRKGGPSTYTITIWRHWLGLPGQN